MTDEQLEGPWESLDEVSKPNLDEVVDYFSGKGIPHPVSSAIEDMRTKLLSLGFDEIQTSPFMEFNDVKTLTGHLFPVFRDTIYHLNHRRLTGLPPSALIELRIRRNLPDLDLAMLWNLIDSIDEETSAEEFMLWLNRELGLGARDAIAVLNLIPELIESGTVDPSLTMRAFMPTAWIETLAATFDVNELPIRLFTVAQNYRREPVEDENHLRMYNVLSMAIVDREITLDRSKSIVRRIMDSLDATDLRLGAKRYQFPYFVEGTELELFGREIEIGTFGLIDRKVLDAAGVDASVMVLDIGVERLLMLRSGYPDIRALSLPQFHAAWDISDEELSTSISVVRGPQSDVGRDIASSIERSVKVHFDEPLPKVTAWKGWAVKVGEAWKLHDMKDGPTEGAKPAEVVLREAKDGMGVAGPAALDELIVLEGNILGVPRAERKRLEENGAIPTGWTYSRAFASLAAWKIERSLDKGSATKKVEMVRSLQDINLRIEPKCLHYVISSGKRVEVKGPVYLKCSFRVREQ